MLVARTYADYVDELARISDLYYATVKRAAKEPAATQDDPMDWEPTRSAAASGRGRMGQSGQGGSSQKRAR